MFPFEFAPGTWVRVPKEPDWGLGQVQSCIGGLLTANFEQAGKQVLKLDVCHVEIVDRQI